MLYLFRICNSNYHSYIHTNILCNLNCKSSCNCFRFRYCICFELATDTMQPHRYTVRHPLVPLAPSFAHSLFNTLHNCFIIIPAHSLIHFAHFTHFFLTVYLWLKQQQSSSLLRISYSFSKGLGNVQWQTLLRWRGEVWFEWNGEWCCEGCKEFIENFICIFWVFK
jgi:hypothetical protein